MALQHAYAITNKAAGLAATAFTWSNGASANRAYLNDARMDKVFSVGTVASGVSVVVDLGTAQAVAAIAILNSNIAAASAPSITIQAADDAAFTTGVVTPKAASAPNTTAPRHKDHVLQFSSTSKRYWKIAWTWTGSFALTVGELFLAVPTALTRAMVFGNAETEEFVGTRFRSSTGETRGHHVAGPYRIRALAFEDLGEDERDEVLAMFRATFGGALPLLWCERYEAVSTPADAAHQNVIYGRLEEQELSITEFDYERFTPNGLTIRSLGREVGA